MIGICRAVLLALGLVCLAPQMSMASEKGAELPEGKPIALVDVPAPALSAARKELETNPSAAKTVSFEGQPAYLLEGINRYDKHVVVVVGAEGKVLKPVNIWDADDD